MASAGWAVTSQLTDQIENTQSGQTLVGVRIFFLTADGNEGSVFVPNVHYAAKHVHALINKQADLIDDIGRLSRGTV